MKITYLLLLFFFTFVTGQVISPDSVIKISKDSVKIKKVSPLTLNELASSFSFQVDSSKAIMFDELPFMGYQGLADLFRTDPQMQVYDFLEMGLPRFTAPLHLWPQQSRIFKDGFLLNDPTHGMYNTRLVFPDALAWILPLAQQSDASSFPGHDLTFQSRFILQDEPYTRIMYREGDFSYTDLDITFATQIDPKTLLQLGGINRDYALTYYRGTHYRGQLTRLLGNKALLRIFYYKSSENVNFLDYYGQQFGRFRYNEVRQDVSAQLFWLSEQNKPDWQVDARFENSRRKYRFTTDGQLLRLRFDRYAIDFSKPIYLVGLPMKFLMQLNQVKAWGTPYSRKYTDSEMQLHWLSSLRIQDKIEVRTHVTLLNRWYQNSQVNPLLSLTYQRHAFSVNWTLESYARFPTIHERFFHFQGLQGQRTLLPERHFNSDVAFRLNPTYWLALEWGLVSHQVNEEILFDVTHFYNAPRRHFHYLYGKSKFTFFKFKLSIGGQSGLNGELIGPDYSAFVHLRYSDWWYHKRILIKASGTVQWLGPAKKVAYQPYAEHFYLLGGKWTDQVLLHYKISAKIKDAILFMEMDNATGQQYQIINGYPELYRRVRFGLSWVLWD